jgi:hypothetical protein
VSNPVLRGDLRARAASPKIFAIELFYLGVLGVLAWLGMPPELGAQGAGRTASLTTALLVVQAIIVTYFTSACAAQEIAVETEKSSVDLVFAPFAPRSIVAGKSLATLATAGYWVLLGAPLVALSAGIRQDPAAGLVSAWAFIAAVAWSMGQMGLWLGIAIESDFSRTLAHWGLLLLVFVGTLALPLPVRTINPVLGISAAQSGALTAAAFAAYIAFGIACDAGARTALRRFVAA